MTDVQLERATGSIAPVLERLARFGFAAKGFVAVVVGTLALRYALGMGGEITGQEGAIQAVIDEPFRAGHSHSDRRRTSNS